MVKRLIITWLAIIMTLPLLGREKYVYNGMDSNWWLSAGGGVNIYMNSINDYSGRGSRAAAIDATLGKWVSPDFGLRIGYQGLQGHMQGKDAGKETFDFWYLHGDALWNMSNTFGGYKERRFWSSSLYAHAGAERIYNHSIENFEGRVNKYDNEVAFGVGLYNTMRLSSRLHATIDIRETMMPSRYHTMDTGGITSNLSITAGIGVYLGKVGWTPVEKYDTKSLTEAQDALAEARRVQDSLRNNPVIIEKVDTLVQRDTTIIKDIPEITVFFAKGSSTLSEVEEYRLRQYVENTDIKQAVMIASADRQTGNDALNMKLCFQRAETVARLLQEYGVETRLERIAIEKDGSAVLNRAVKISPKDK